MSHSLDQWKGRSILLLGHTGFKGGWLAMWLASLGARVHGLALDPPTQPNFFDAARVRSALQSDARADIADLPALVAAMNNTKPEVVFHLAAQSLVQESYRNPVGTFTTNVIGTAHVLEATRQTPSVRAVVVVTSDKVYDNKEWLYGYREADTLGGHDPYSASKAAAEIVTSSYRAAFFGADPCARIATARAGNVIGGGDWAQNRLVPDCFRAFSVGQKVTLRFPNSVRPWQHVLEPLAGYLMLADKLLGDDGAQYARAWNFGPNSENEASAYEVASLTAGLLDYEAAVDVDASGSNPHEAGLLRLDSTLARSLLHWQPRLTLRTALDLTVAWHKAWLNEEDMTAFTHDQIQSYKAELPC